VLYLKRYFGVSFAAMLRKVKELGYVSAAQFEDHFKRNPDSREREVFGMSGRQRARGEPGKGMTEGRTASPGRPIFSDRYKLLRAEAAKKKAIAKIEK